MLIIGDGFPKVVRPETGCPALEAVGDRLREVVADRLEIDGALLFRGFADPGVEGFQAFARACGHPLLSYEFGSTPRSQVTGGGVYTSTEYPAHRSIPLHNEQAYTTEWPMRIWFYCARAAEQGGETPIADSREVYRRIDPALRRRFDERGLRYTRNYGNGLDVDWPQVFNTSDPAAVEAFCRKLGIEAIWKADGSLRTMQRCQATATHPRTGERVWFNQAHLFHISAHDPEMQEVLLETVGEENLPRNVYYGDGSPIEASVLDEIRGVLAQCRVVFPWCSGDILMLDNMLVAHSREPFSGARKVVVAMAESYSEGHGRQKMTSNPAVLEETWTV